MKETQMVELTETMDRLSAAIEQLEETVRASSAATMAASAHTEETIGKIVATVENARELELERKLAEAEAKIATLAAETKASGRKTVARMMAKESSAAEGMDSHVIDAALVSLSVEQRIAVKSELLRAGLV